MRRHESRFHMGILLATWSRYKVLTYGRRPSVAAEGGKKADENASEDISILD